MATRTRRSSIKVTALKALTEPYFSRDAGGLIQHGLMIETATWEKGELHIAGWAIGAFKASLLRGGVAAPADVTRALRTDVAAGLGLDQPGDGFGFVLNAKVPYGSFELEWHTEVAGTPVIYRLDVPVPEPLQAGQSRPGALGHLEGAAYFPDARCVVVGGWALTAAPRQLWVETSEGDRSTLESAFRIFRQDVFDAFGRGMASTTPSPGFVLGFHVEGSPAHVRLMTQDDGAPTPRVVNQIDCATMRCNALDAYKWLMGLNTHLTKLHERLPKVDSMVLEPLIESDRASWKHLPVTKRELGTQIAKPKASIIVPLYGRADFVEHQLVEFAKDEWLTKHVQIIYVLDDPKLVEPFYMQAEALHRLYQIPFMWVWGAVNRGFSGANNLGAQFAKGEHLVFLNSDAFPDAPGWVEALQHTLYVHPKVGAVGPNLVFATGGIQHAGMQFLRRDELGIWINHHPHMGLDPILDPHKSLTTVPGITGACLAMRRTDFDAVGGWEQGYLIGDFEDSDLCFKLRSKGFDIAYDPSVRLTHLERQSFKLLGQDEFRTRVVIYNAVRHQNRWGQLLSESSTL